MGAHVGHVTFVSWWLVGSDGVLNKAPPSTAEFNPCDSTF